MRLAGIIKQSLIDYPGEIAAVLFTRGCNFSCPYCHNSHLLYKRQGEADLPLENVLSFLKERQGFLDGVVFTGGEPTKQPELEQAMEEIKQMGYKIKLDTNGARPDLLARLLDKKLIDYVAMDVKAPLDYKKYYAACGGRLSSHEFLNVRNSIYLLLLESPVMVEFRTTIVPSLHSKENIRQIAQAIEGARLFTLQQFYPDNAMDINLRGTATYSREDFDEMAELCAPYVGEVRIINF
ncbi:MAG: anaerobic ribonucleoside-triphosphate reductase activating protein [Syntrophomonas sp.]